MNYLEYFKGELRNRNYAQNTIKAYTKYLKKYLEFNSQCKKTDPKEIMADFIDCFAGAEQKRLAYGSIKSFYRFVIINKCLYQINKKRIIKGIPISTIHIHCAILLQLTF